MADKTYQEQQITENEKRLRNIQQELPEFCRHFFIGMKQAVSSRTLLSYAYDLRLFFDYLQKTNATIGKMNLRTMDLEVLELITPMDIEEYLDYLTVYERNGNEHTNNERGIARKLASLRTFYNYFFRLELIEKNPPARVKTPKLPDKNIVRLDVDEMVKLLDEVESGENLTAKQKSYHKQTKVRDLAILTLMLGTGIRVSECAGIDLTDLDFSNNGINIHRKGGKEVMIYFGDEVLQALDQYLMEREQIIPCTGHENALFLSLQKKRMSVRTIEKLVKKYAQLVTTAKKITPHKLRSTFGTNLYQETGDIYLVADVLGHNDVNTTKKHYAALEDQRRRQAVKHVKLRDID